MAAPEVVLAISFFLCIFLASGNELARGWGDDIKWVKLEEGQETAKAQNKYLMVLIHKTWCGACKSLKPKFAANNEIKALSEKFVMVNTQDDEEPDSEDYSPDGGYIPRIIFVDPKGQVRKEFINEGGNQKYKYYYPAAEDVAQSMKLVLKTAERGGSAKEDL